jgi:hypothetical protein
MTTDQPSEGPGPFVFGGSNTMVWRSDTDRYVLCLGDSDSHHVYIDKRQARQLTAALLTHFPDMMKAT